MNHRLPRTAPTVPDCKEGPFFKWRKWALIARLAILSVVPTGGLLAKPAQWVLGNQSDRNLHFYLAPDSGNDIKIPVPARTTVVIAMPDGKAFYQVWDDGTGTMLDAGYPAGSTDAVTVSLWWQETTTQGGFLEGDLPGGGGGGGSPTVPEDPTDAQMESFLEGFWFSIGCGLLVFLASYARSLGRSTPPL